MWFGLIHRDIVERRRSPVVAVLEEFGLDQGSSCTYRSLVFCLSSVEVDITQ